MCASDNKTETIVFCDVISFDADKVSVWAQVGDLYCVRTAIPRMQFEDICLYEGLKIVWNMDRGIVRTRDFMNAALLAERDELRSCFKPLSHIK